jgi:two-component system, NtrC family, sensor kinase
VLAHFDSPADGSTRLASLAAPVSAIADAAIAARAPLAAALPALMGLLPHAYALALAVCVRGSARTVAIVLALYVARCASMWLAQRWSGETSRAVHSVLMDGMFAVAMSHAATWAWPSWLYLPFFVVVVFQPVVRDRSREIASHRRALAARERELTAAGEEIAVLKRRLAECDKLTSLGMLAAGVAHEINNPMAYVTSNVKALAEALQELEPLPVALRIYAEAVVPDALDGIARVNTIVADLRRFARGDRGATEEYDLNAQVEAALRISQGQWRAKATIERSLGKLPPARGCPQRITQVLVNLIVNAAQAIPERGTIAISTRGDPDEVHVEVRDTGAGMTPEAMNRLFQPFFTTKPEGVGTGLGLAVAHGIVRSHGGRIEVRSELGRGSTFSVHLPRVPPASTAGSRRAGTTSLRTAL